MRVSTACLACRSRRRRCHAPEFSTSCTYCSSRGIHCTRSFLSPRARPPHENNPVNLPVEDVPPATSKAHVQLPPVDVCIELTHLYFDLIHDQFHSLFHRPSMIRDVEEGRTRSVILFAIIALSARFSTNPFFDNIRPRDRGVPYAKESNSLLNLRDVSLETAQACVLLGSISITENEAAAESVYYCAACRIANLLDIANKPTNSRLEREINIRVWWSLCMIDVWSSTGVRLPKQMPSIDNLPLPCDEEVFLNLTTDDFTIEYSSPSPSSLLAQMIKLNRILLEINELNTRTVAGHVSGTILENAIMQLSNKLDDWHAGLPSFMHDNTANLQSYASQGLGRIFVAVYLGYYHFGQLLFYQFLHGDSHSTVLPAQFYANKCKAYAQSLCEIVYSALAIPHCDVQYTMVGHILVIASTVQIHSLLFGEHEADISAARRRLEKNFEILTTLRQFWPTLDISFTRLRAFHQACRDSMDESFRLDQWMLQFLYEFAEPVSDKVVGQSPDMRAWSWESIGFSPQG